MSSAGGFRISSSGRELWPPSIGVWPLAVPSSYWLPLMKQRSVELFNFIAACTHPTAVLLFKNGVTSQAYRPPLLLGSSRHAQSSHKFQRGSVRPAISTFKIDKIVESMIDVTIRSIDSSSPGQCHENRYVLVAPTLFPSISGSR